MFKEYVFNWQKANRKTGNTLEQDKIEKLSVQVVRVLCLLKLIIFLLVIGHIISALPYLYIFLSSCIFSPLLKTAKGWINFCSCNKVFFEGDPKVHGNNNWYLADFKKVKF